MLYYSFFILVNIVGAAIGYWLSKARFPVKLPHRKVHVEIKNVIAKMNESTGNIAIAIMGITPIICSAYAFYNAYYIWSKYIGALSGLDRSVLGIIQPSDVAFSKILMAIKEYVISFPLYFLVGLVTATLGLILITTRLGRRILLVAAILIISSAFLFFEAYKIWEIYQWATIWATIPALSYYGRFLSEASDAYFVWFPLYIQIGIIAMMLGLLLSVIGIKERFKAKKEASAPKPFSDNSSSSEILV